MRNRNMALALVTLGLSLLLSGCVFRSVDELYAVPAPPQDYEALQACLSEVIAQGGEYAAPLSGDLIQSVQLQDLDGDGRQEAIAFFRISGDEKPMKIYIFRQSGSGYQTMSVIEGAATAINSIEYVQMDEDPFRELVVTWQMNTSRSLSVYSVGSEVVELLRTDYDAYKLWDLDQDNRQELIIFRTPSESIPRLELYDYEGTLTMAGAAALSNGGVIGGDGLAKSDYLKSVQTGYLSDRTPAIFATLSYAESQEITDIFVVQNGRPKNVTLDATTYESRETIRSYTQAPIMDINGDGIMEVPQPVPMNESRRIGLMVSFWMVHWRQFDSAGQSQKVMSTYYNGRDGWYFEIPEEWEWEKNLVMSRSDLSGGGEQAVTFSYWSGVEGEDPLPFLTIYKLTGTNRVSRSKRAGRFNITPARADDSVIYAAEFRNGWDSGLSEEDVKTRFAVVRTDWYS